MSNLGPEAGFSAAALSDKARSQLLAEAATTVDNMRAHLGPGDSGSAETSAGSLLRALSEDNAEFPASPDVQPITDEDFLARGLPVPVPFAHLAAQYNFYSLDLPILLFPQRHWAFNRLEVAVEFNPGDTQAARPKAYKIFPDKKFQTLLKAGDSLEVGLDNAFEFNAKVRTPDVTTPAVTGGANVASNAKAAAKLNLVVGPFEYHIKKAKIDHSPTGHERVFWRLDGAEFFEEDPARLLVIVQVPKATTTLQIDAAMQAYRNFSWASADIQAAVSQLTASIRNFLTAGAPLRSEKKWPTLTL